MDRINKCELIDLGAVGAKFTWRGPLYNDFVVSLRDWIDYL